MICGINTKTIWLFASCMFNEICGKIHNEVLISLEDLDVVMSGKMLHKLGMPAPNRLIHGAFNLEIERERQYDRNTLSPSVQNKVPLLNQQQKIVYDMIIFVI